MRTFTLLLLVAMPLMADELVLKDGKKVEFKTLSDEGDSWEVTTPQGTKLTVKKADFDRLVPSGAAEAPLTGATFTFDKKRKLETVDLLSKIDPKRDGIAGTWKLVGGRLVGMGATSPSKLQINYTPPEEYDLNMVIERKEGESATGVGLIGGGRQFVFIIDAYKNSWTGPSLIDGKEFKDNGVGVPGKVFENGKPKTFTFMVRKEALIVQVDGKDHTAWKANWNRVSLPPSLVVQQPNMLFLVQFQSTYTISRMVLTAPKEQ